MYSFEGRFVDPGEAFCGCFATCDISNHNKFLVGLVVKASASRAADRGFNSCLHRDISRSSRTSHLRIGTPVATLPGAWRYRVSAGTGWPSVSIL